MVALNQNQRSRSARPWIRKVVNTFIETQQSRHFRNSKGDQQQRGEKTQEEIKDTLPPLVTSSPTHLCSPQGMWSDVSSVPGC